MSAELSFALEKASKKAMSSDTLTWAQQLSCLSKERTWTGKSTKVRRSDSLTLFVRKDNEEIGK